MTRESDGGNGLGGESELVNAPVLDVRHRIDVDRGNGAAGVLRERSDNAGAGKCVEWNSDRVVGANEVPCGIGENSAQGRSQLPIGVEPHASGGNVNAPAAAATGRRGPERGHDGREQGDGVPSARHRRRGRHGALHRCAKGIGLVVVGVEVCVLPQGAVKGLPGVCPGASGRLSTGTYSVELCLRRPTSADTSVQVDPGAPRLASTDIAGGDQADEAITNSYDHGVLPVRGANTRMERNRSQ